MKVLVTGISGFIGSHVAAAMAALGHEVTGTYRGNPPRFVERYREGFLGQSVPGGRVEAVKADLSDRGSVADVTAGTDAVIHIAGFAWDWGPEEKFYRANVLPVEYFLDIIADSGDPPAVFIHTSSLSVHGFGHQRDSSEDGPYYRPISHYQRSKLESEEIFTAAALRKTARGIIRPGNVYGPGDTTTMYPILDAIRDGKMGLVDRGKHLTCPVFIDDLVNAYVLLFHRLLEDGNSSPPAVRLFNITGDETISWHQQIQACCAAADLPFPRLQTPGWLAMAAAGILTAAYRLVGAKNPPDITPYRIQQVSHDYDFSMERAKRELGWEARYPFERGIAETVSAWRQHDQ
jgi:nucleoside-diphosphate-sugar epimerase